MKRTWYEAAARKAGHVKGIRFRMYRRWGMYPIKAYIPHADPQDFKTWKEAYEWVNGV
ncbi:hypothetical protein GCM10023228_16570 [Brevibacillus fulvus]